jgi:hypothetical protein
MRKATKVVASDVASDIEENIMVHCGRSGDHDLNLLTKAYRNLIPIEDSAASTEE